jgi:hypothetical protein
MRHRRPGYAGLFFDDFSMSASLAAVRADAVEPEVMLLAAITTGAALPGVDLPEVPTAAPALRVTVEALGVVRLVSHQPASAAATSIPIMLFVARVSAAPAFAAIPIVEKDTRQFHKIPFDRRFTAV